jgi:hypothetical protein
LALLFCILQGGGEEEIDMLEVYFQQVAFVNE